MHYRREIDGLRAVAVLPVILFHAGFSWFSGGYVGVDVFFVISGYLITTILIGEIESGTFSIAKFYERRARRILPALFFVMLCCIPVAWFWMVPAQFKDFSQSLVAVSLFASNILFWKKEDYFAPEAEESPLLHTWSLAVEEQFYICFPLLLLMLWRFGRNPVFYIVVMVSAFSLLLSEYGWRNYPSANFYLLPTRAWELGVGAICAFLLYGKSLKGNQVLSALGLLLIVFSIFTYDKTVPFPSVYALVPVIGSALIILFASQDTLTARLLSTKALVGIGLISFSAYLWHQPLLAFARIRHLPELSLQAMAGISVASIFLAYLTWRYVEKPFRTHGAVIVGTRSKVFAASAVVTVLFSTLGLYGHITDGASYRVDLPGELKKDLYVREFHDECFDFSMSMINKQGFFCSLGKQGAEPEVAVLGDSHSLSFIGPLNAFFKENDKAFVYSGISGCPPLYNLYVLRRDDGREVCNRRNQEVFDQIIERGIKKVILISRWTYYSTGDISGGFVYVGSEYDVSRDEKRSFEVLKRHLEKTLEFFDAHGVEIIVFHQVPVQKVDARSFYSFLSMFAGGDFNSILEAHSLKQSSHDKRYGDLRKVIDGKVAMFDNSHAINFDDALCEKGLCLIGEQSRSFYFDDDHLSNFGASYVLDRRLDTLFGSKMD